MREIQARQLGRMITAARRKKGWSQRQLEIRTGIPHTWLAELERGHYRQPAPDRIALIIDVLGMPIKPVDQILGGSLEAAMLDWRRVLRLTFNLTNEEARQVEDFVLAMVDERDGKSPGNRDS